jgi:hypothetical protein
MARARALGVRFERDSCVSSFDTASASAGP